MKKLFLVMLFCFVLVLLCACGGKVEKPTEAPTEAPTEVSDEYPTEAPYDAPGKGPAEDATEIQTEPSTETSTEDPVDTPVTAWGDNSDVRDDLAYFTVELTQTVYTTNDEHVRFRFRAKNPGYTGFSDNWTLYKFVDGEKIYVGSNPLETAFELSPKTEDGYVDCEMSFSFWYIFRSDGQRETLEAGKYCLEKYSGDHVIARLTFEVVEAE